MTGKRKCIGGCRQLDKKPGATDAVPGFCYEISPVIWIEARQGGAGCDLEGADCQTFCSSISHSFAGSMPSKNRMANPCPYSSFFSFLRESPSAPTKAIRINGLPGLMSASAISEINASVMTVSSRTNARYPVEDGRRNVTVSVRSFWMARSVY